MTTDDTPDRDGPPHRVGLRRRLPHMPTRVGLPMALALALFLSGPRAAVDDDDVEAVDVPADVAAWIAESEADIAGIRPGDEKTLVWHDSTAPGPTPWSVVYLHGFSGDRHDIDPVPHRVAEALGANLFLTRLTGHGRDGDALAEATAEDWLRDAVEAVAVGRILGERVILMGTSTGATLAVWAAASERLDADPDGLVLLSPNFHPADPNSRLLLLPWGGALARLVIGPERCWEPDSEAEARHFTTCYPTRALLPMMALVERVRSMDLSGIGTPTLVVYSPDDQVVDTNETRRLFEEIGAERKRLEPFTASADPEGHLLGGDIKSPRSTDALVSLILDFLANEAEAGATP